MCHVSDDGDQTIKILRVGVLSGVRMNLLYVLFRKGYMYKYNL